MKFTVTLCVVGQSEGGLSGQSRPSNLTNRPRIAGKPSVYPASSVLSQGYFREKKQEKKKKKNNTPFLCEGKEKGGGRQ